DGVSPGAGLLEGTNGGLYGTTPNGGTGYCQGSSGQVGCGTIFSMSKDGSSYRILHTFNRSGDGLEPGAGLPQGNDVVLYGTTYAGGTNDGGTVFALKPDGSGYTNLHTFGSIAADGRSPGAALIQGSDGALYGNTSSGGSNFSGTIFRLNRDGSGYRIL